MSRVVSSYFGVQRSLQPHGLRSKVVVAAVLFVGAFGGALALVSPAQAGSVIYPAQPWKVLDWASGATSGVPATDSSATCDMAGLTKPGGDGSGRSIEDADLNANGTTLRVHYHLDSPSDAANGAVRLFYYATANQNTFSTAPTDFAVASPGTPDGWLTLTVAGGHVGTMGMTFDASNDNGGTVTFDGVALDGTPVMLCSDPGPVVTVSPSPSPSPVNVPGPTHTVIVNHTQVVTVTPAPTQTTVAPTDNPTPPPTFAPTTTSAPTPVVVKPVANNNSMAPLLWGVGSAGAGLLLALALVKGVRARRERYDDDDETPTGRHSVANADTQVIPAVHDPKDDGYSIGDYHPSGGYAPELGGSAGSSLQTGGGSSVGDGGTPAEPPVSPPANTDTQPLPPAQ